MKFLAKIAESVIYRIDLFESKLWGLWILILWGGLAVVNAVELWRLPIGQRFLLFGQSECEAAMRRMKAFKDKYTA